MKEEDILKNVRSPTSAKNDIEKNVKNAFFSKFIKNVLNVRYIYALWRTCWVCWWLACWRVRPGMARVGLWCWRWPSCRPHRSMETFSGRRSIPVVLRLHTCRRNRPCLIHSNISQILNLKMIRIYPVGRSSLMLTKCHIDRRDPYLGPFLSFLYIVCRFDNTWQYNTWLDSTIPH